MSQWLNDEAFSRGRATLPKLGAAQMNGYKQPVSFTRSELHVNTLPVSPAKTSGSALGIQSVLGPVPDKTSSKVQTCIRRLLQMKEDNEERLQQMKVQTEMLALGKTDKRSKFKRDCTQWNQASDIYHKILKTAHSTAEPTSTTVVQEINGMRIEQESSERYPLSVKSLGNENDLVKSTLVSLSTPQKELFLVQDGSKAPSEGSDIPQTFANHISSSLRDNETAVHKVNAICQILDRMVEKEIQFLVENRTSTHHLSGINCSPRSETSENFKIAFLKRIAMSQKLIFGETAKNEVNIMKRDTFCDSNLENASPTADEAIMDNSENGIFLDSREVDCLIKGIFATKKLEAQSSIRNDVCKTSQNLRSPKSNTTEKKDEHLLENSNHVCEMIDDENVYAMNVYGKFSGRDSLPRDLTATEKVEAFLAHTECVDKSRRNASSKEEFAVNNFIAPEAVSSKIFGFKVRYEEEIDNMKTHFESNDSDSSPIEPTAAEKLEAFPVCQGQVFRARQDGSLPKEENSKIDLPQRVVSSKKEGCSPEGMVCASKAIQDSTKKKRMSSVDLAKSSSTIEKASIKEGDKIKKAPLTVPPTNVSVLRYNEEMDRTWVNYDSSESDSTPFFASHVCRPAQHTSMVKEGTIVLDRLNTKEDCITEGMKHDSKAVQDSIKKKQVNTSNAIMSDSTQQDLPQKGEEAEMKQISPKAPTKTFSKLRYEEEINNKKIDYESSESDSSPRERTAGEKVETYSKSALSESQEAKAPTVSWLTQKEETSTSEDKSRLSLEGLDDSQTPIRHTETWTRDTTPTVVNIIDVDIVAKSSVVYSCIKINENSQPCVASPGDKLEALARCNEEEYADDFEEESEEGDCSDSYEESESSDEYIQGNRTAFERQKAENPAWVRPLLLPTNPYSFILLSRYSDTSYKSIKDRLGVKALFQSRPSVVGHGPMRAQC